MSDPKERGILFSGPMVVAINEGRKTQTRRVVKLREFGPSDTAGYDWHFRDKRMLWNDVSTARLIETRSPFGVPGDRLWVRETFAKPFAGDNGYIYRADGPEYLSVSERKHNWGDSESHQWKPSIFMPRRASRTDLEVTGVRVERLQEISAEDIIAEGLSTRLREHDAYCDLREQFQELWDSLNAKRGYSWDSNPWVFVGHFHPLQRR